MRKKTDSDFISILNQDVEAIRQNKETQRISKIDHLKSEIITLRNLNLSYANIALWLNNQHNIKVNESTVRRRFLLHWSKNNADSIS
ncbi:hypothetical protein [uncultured Vibrio sp.]|uniref:hypothetical protein n=1 Tax=uncultured Vibrio sp. TaxID=114054 RepID=UPI0026369CB9|nr:hypothetical protein [uncultured Vibrio sp.]